MYSPWYILCMHRVDYDQIIVGALLSVLQNVKSLFAMIALPTTPIIKVLGR